MALVIDALLWERANTGYFATGVPAKKVNDGLGKIALGVIGTCT